jgi:CubicO group peptidase (beta-lactamase class C family)
VKVHRLTMLLLVTMTVTACGARPSGPGALPGMRVMAESRTDDESLQARHRRLAAALVDVDAMVGEQVAALKFPGVAVAVLDRGRRIWSRTYGVSDLNRREPVSHQTVFRIGSITKTICAMATLVLREKGRVDLDAPAVRYLPELNRVNYPSADSPPITLRHILTHTSGLPRLGRFDYASARSKPVTEAEVLASLRGLRLKHAPGTVNEYSNFGYALLGVLLQRVSGQSLRKLLAGAVLEPLGMKSAQWEASSVPARLLATGYHWDGERYLARHHWKLGAAEGMGGLYLNLDDMNRYVGFHMTAWPPGTRADGPPLRSATVRESHMLGGFQRPGRIGNGHGWGVVQLRGVNHVVFHTGATHQYAAVIMFSPSGETAFVAMANTNRAYKPLDKLAGKVIQRLER